jgi:nucleotide-binding universal stress UspA family protein
MSKIGINLKRILLPVDVSRDSLAALDVAFDLALALGGEVSGLFIEDAALLAAGSLPFAREIGSHSGISRRIASTDIHHRFRAVADKARKAIAFAGQRSKVRSSFRVAQGNVTMEILSASTNADLLILGKAGWSAGAFRKPGSTCLAILSRTQIPVLVVEAGVRISPPIIAVDDGSDTGRRASDFARELGDFLSWPIAGFSSEGMATADEVLERIPQEAPRLIVLPTSLLLTERACRLKSTVLFVP